MKLSEGLFVSHLWSQSDSTEQSEVHQVIRRTIERICAEQIKPRNLKQNCPSLSTGCKMVWKKSESSADVQPLISAAIK